MHKVLKISLARFLGVDLKRVEFQRWGSFFLEINCKKVESRKTTWVILCARESQNLTLQASLYPQALLYYKLQLINLLVILQKK